jgi:sugar phosphate permease
MENLSLTYVQMGLVGSCFYWLYSVAEIAGAAWSDRIGTKKMLTIMEVVWMILQFQRLPSIAFRYFFFHGFCSAHLKDRFLQPLSVS